MKLVKAVPERTEGERHVSLTAKYVVASKSNLQVFGRLEADLLPEHVRPGGKLMALRALRRSSTPRTAPGTLTAREH